MIITKLDWSIICDAVDLIFKGHQSHYTAGQVASGVFESRLIITGNVGIITTIGLVGWSEDVGMLWLMPCESP